MSRGQKDYETDLYEDEEIEDEKPRTYSQIYASKQVSSHKKNFFNKPEAQSHPFEREDTVRNGTAHLEQRLVELHEVLEEERDFKDQLMAENIALRSLIDPKIASKAANENYVRISEELKSKRDESKSCEIENDNLKLKIKYLEEQVKELREINIEAQSNLQLAVVSVKEAREVDIRNKRLQAEVDEMKERLASMTSYSRESEFFNSKDLIDENDRLKKDLAEKKDGRDVMYSVIKTINECIEKVTGKPQMTSSSIGRNASASLLSLELSSLLSILHHEAALTAQRNSSLVSRNKSLQQDYVFLEKQHSQLSEELLNLRNRCSCMSQHNESSLTGADACSPKDRSLSGHNGKKGSKQLGGSEEKADEQTDATMSEVEYLGRRIQKEIAIRSVHRAVIQRLLDTLGDKKLTDLVELCIRLGIEGVENDWTKEEVKKVLEKSQGKSPEVQIRLEELFRREVELANSRSQYEADVEHYLETYRTLLTQLNHYRQLYESLEAEVRKLKQQDKLDSSFSERSSGIHVISRPAHSSQSVNIKEEDTERILHDMPKSPKQVSAYSRSVHKTAEIGSPAKNSISKTI